MFECYARSSAKWKGPISATAELKRWSMSTHDTQVCRRFPLHRLVTSYYNLFETISRLWATHVPLSVSA